MSRRRTFDDYKSTIREIYRRLSSGPYTGSVREGGNIYRDVMEILTDFGYVLNMASRYHPSYVWSERSVFPSDEEIQELIDASLDKNRQTHKKRDMEESGNRQKGLSPKVDRKITAIVELLLQGKNPDRIYRELNENPERWGGSDGARISFDYIEDKLQIWRRLGRPKDPSGVIDEYRKASRRDRQSPVATEAAEQDGVLFPGDPNSAVSEVGNMPIVSKLDNLLLMIAIGLETIASEIRGYIDVYPENDAL